jgi:DNA polymerase-3 subunit beta
LEIAISCWIGAKVEKEGAITVPARLLTDYTSLLPNEKIDINLTKNTLHLKCARSETSINGLDAADFPPIPEVTDGINTKIEREALRDGINQVSFAAATEESRPVLTGVQLEFDGDKLILAAADGFRLAVHYTSVLTPVSAKTAIIVPAKALVELSRFLSDQDESVEIIVNQQKSQALFRLKNVEMVSQLIQGVFPNYSQLIPQKYATRAVVDLTQFLQAIKMASIFARDGSGIVRMEMTPGPEMTAGKMNISARAEEIGENIGEVDALIDGEPAKIAFNAKYVSDVLGVIKQKQVALETTTSSSPGVIRPIGVSNYVHVVMPMFVQW